MTEDRGLNNFPDLLRETPLFDSSRETGTLLNLGSLRRMIHREDGKSAKAKKDKHFVLRALAVLAVNFCIWFGAFWRCSITAKGVAA